LLRAAFDEPSARITWSSVPFAGFSTFEAAFGEERATLGVKVCIMICCFVREGY
jgi:hypothetical protein